VDENDQVATEFEIKSLGVNLSILAECLKTTQVSIINRKVFKITCYFVSNLKNLKLQSLPQRHFDW
jgi:hypothetical protein